MIRRTIAGLFLLVGMLFFASCVHKPAEKAVFNAVQYVDPQIGSVHGRWFFYTPAALPFGMAKVAPQTNAARFWIVSWTTSKKQKQKFWSHQIQDATCNWTGVCVKQTCRNRFYI